MTRRSISTRERLRLLELHDSTCHICGCEIDPIRDAWDIEHVLPLALGGDDSDENRKPAHRSCHKPKTADDVAKIRKADRVRAKHLGAKRARRALPGSRDSKWKKPIFGPAVPR